MRGQTARRLKKLPIDELLLTSTDELVVSVRTYNAVFNHRSGLKAEEREERAYTIGELTRFSSAELRTWRNVGQKTLREVTARLAELGLRLADNEPTTYELRKDWNALDKRVQFVLHGDIEDDFEFGGDSDDCAVFMLDLIQDVRHWLGRVEKVAGVCFVPSHE